MWHLQRTCRQSHCDVQLVMRTSLSCACFPDRNEFITVVCILASINFVSKAYHGGDFSLGFGKKIEWKYSDDNLPIVCCSMCCNLCCGVRCSMCCGGFPLVLRCVLHCLLAKGHLNKSVRRVEHKANSICLLSDSAARRTDSTLHESCSNAERCLLDPKDTNHALPASLTSRRSMSCFKIRW